MQKIMFNDQYGLTDAVLTDRKTQTRIIAMRSAEDAQVLDKLELKTGDKRMIQYIIDKYSRYKVGETLAVAQSLKDLSYDGKDTTSGHIWGLDKTPAWTNKMFVVASQCKNFIRITNIRLERLQDISDEDCIKEGIIEDSPGVQYSFPTEIGYCGQYPFGTPKAAYAALIDKVSGKGTWEKNPWVFVYDFELVK